MADVDCRKVLVAGVVLPDWKRFGAKKFRISAGAAGSTATAAPAVNNPSDALCKLIADVLIDAGLAREARLGIFVCDEIRVSALRALEERFHPVVVEPAI